MNKQTILLLGISLISMQLCASGDPAINLASLGSMFNPAAAGSADQGGVPGAQASNMMIGMLDYLQTIGQHPLVKSMSDTTKAAFISAATATAQTIQAGVKMGADYYEGRRKAAEETQRRTEARVAQEIDRLMHDHTIQPDVRNALIANLNAERQAARDDVERWKKLQTDAIQIALDSAKEGIQAFTETSKMHAQASIRYNEAAITAQGIADGHVRGVEKQIAAVTNTENLQRFAKFIGFSALLFFSARYGTELVSDRIRYLYRNPELAQETSLKTVPQQIQQLVLGREKRAFDLTDVVLDPELAARIRALSDTVTNIKQHNGFFRHALFSGPPGTGKTMVAKLLAAESGVDYIYFSGSSLRKYPIAEALIKIDEVFNDPRKRVIVIDECEQAVKKRSLLEEQNDTFGLQVLDHILTLTGTESKNFMLIGMTNRPEMIDAAFLSRCDERVIFKAPNADEIKRILKLYITKWLLKDDEIERGWGLIKLFPWLAKKKLTKITIAPDALSETVANAIAERLAAEGFVGRDISKLVIAWKSRAYAAKNGVLTSAIIEEELAAKIQKKRVDLH